MKVRRVADILTQTEVARLRVILTRELAKPQNNNHSTLLLMYVRHLEDITFHEHYLSLLNFMKYYKTQGDSEIKQKLQDEYGNRSFDIENFKRKSKQRFHKYTKNDCLIFLRKSHDFFALYRTPFELRNLRNQNYLNRSYLGLGFEFLLKAIFLKRGYLINKINYTAIRQEDGMNNPRVPTRLGALKKVYLKAEINELGYFINNISKIKPTYINIHDFNFYVIRGLVIAQNWRNQDIHTPTQSYSLDNVQAEALLTSYHNLYEIFLPNDEIPVL